MSIEYLVRELSQKSNCRHNFFIFHLFHCKFFHVVIRIDIYMHFHPLFLLLWLASVTLWDRDRAIKSSPELIRLLSCPQLLEKLDSIIIEKKGNTEKLLCTCKLHYQSSLFFFFVINILGPFI